MFQKFNISKTSDNKRKLVELRSKIADHNLDGFIIPHADLYQNEYIESCDSRLEWITGFTGSAGVCLVTLKDAFLFVDGRYTLQARKQSGENFKIITIPKKIPSDVLVGKKMTIGFDPKLHTETMINRLFKNSNCKLIPLNKNLISKI